MPTFDFTCTACKSVFEKTLPFGSKGKPACPACGGRKTEKMISMPGIAFKGSGFYKTDTQQHPSAGADKKIKPEVAEKKPDTKPAHTDSGKTPQKP